MTGCKSPGDRSGQEQAAASPRSSADRGWPATRPRHEFRDLRKRLPGKSMREVKALLGPPAYVFNSGNRESWDYENAVYDSVTGRVVTRLTVWFTRRVADDVRASF